TSSVVEDNTKVELVSSDKCFNGYQKIYKHWSKETKCTMKFSIYIPLQLHAEEKFNAIFFLSGVMCNEQNFIFKTGFQRYASDERIIFIGPDTSPRNVDLPGDRDSWVFGRSAGWYLDSTCEPWRTNYRMYSYITRELPEIIRQNFPITGKFGMCGHSMGGNGAIVCSLRNPTLFQTLSVLAPSCNPTSWGDELIYIPYLGAENRELWKQYDALEVAKAYKGPPKKILADCGSEDEYLHLLLPDKLTEVALVNRNVEVELHMREEYNHSYFFVASFIEKHIKYHAKALGTVNENVTC
ncbi:S-formylglutathione hydrolase, partial [Orchesella cincta]